MKDTKTDKACHTARLADLAKKIEKSEDALREAFDEELDPIVCYERAKKFVADFDECSDYCQELTLSESTGFDVLMHFEVERGGEEELRQALYESLEEIDDLYESAEVMSVFDEEYHGGGEKAEELTKGVKAAKKGDEEEAEEHLLRALQLDLDEEEAKERVAELEETNPELLSAFRNFLHALSESEEDEDLQLKFSLMKLFNHFLSKE